jgi:2-C-methyl-D-erythritol 4-phosphate cytidylyltransferase
MKVSAIIVGAGSGTRLGVKSPKAFVELGRVSLLARVIGTVDAAMSIGEAVIAVPAGTEGTARSEVKARSSRIPLKITPGGIERQDSVRIALALTSIEAGLILIHDAARPFATPAMFEAAIAAASVTGAAITAMPVTDTLKRVESGGIAATMPRADLWHAQTPQVFARDLLIRAHSEAMRQGISVTDDAYLVERLGIKVQVVEGSSLNLKITTPDDLTMAEALVQSGLLR